MKRVGHNQSGIAHVVIVLLVVAVLGGIGAAGYIVMTKNKKASPEAALNTAVAKAAKEECKKLDDKDLCKFFSSWELSKKYRMSSTDPGGSKSVFELDGDKSRITMTGGEYSMDVITIDKTTYTKAGDVWYKQTIKTPDQDVAKDYKQDFAEPEESTETTEDKTTYKSLGKEACGNLTCFKYEVVDPAHADEKQFIWFDTKDYQLRKSRSETKDGVSEQTYEYTNVKISVPSPVKELGPNQYIVPGQSEPMTLPSAADLGAEQ